MDEKQSQTGRRILKVTLFLLLVCGVFFLLLQVRRRPVIPEDSLTDRTVSHQRKTVPHRLRL